jgi:hypothetical protein
VLPSIGRQIVVSVLCEVEQSTSLDTEADPAKKYPANHTT